MQKMPMERVQLETYPKWFRALREEFNESLPGILEGKDPYLAPPAFAGWQDDPRGKVSLRPCQHALAVKAERLGESWEQIRSNRRAQPLPLIRAALFNWARQHWPKATYKEVGRIFNCDHSTVIWWARRHKERLESDPVYQDVWERVNQV